MNEEQSLDETKNVVRKKLGLGHDAAVELAQLRDGRMIDLEDGVSSPRSFTKSQVALDDDFEAFKALTKTSLQATVVVIIPNDGSSSPPPVVCGRIPRRLILILLTMQRRRRVFQWKGEETPMTLMPSLAPRMPRTLARFHLRRKAVWCSYLARVLLIHLVPGKSRRSISMATS